MLAAAGHRVLGTDIAPAMVALAKERVVAEKGGQMEFAVGDMLTWEPSMVGQEQEGEEGEEELMATFDAVFLVFSQLQLGYADLRRVLVRFARTLKEDGGVVRVGADAGG